MNIRVVIVFPGVTSDKTYCQLRRLNGCDVETLKREGWLEVGGDCVPGLNDLTKLKEFKNKTLGLFVAMIQ